jgi:hypothetical protein
MPPIVNNNKNPIAKKNGVFQRRIPPHMVAIQLNIFIPVGMPMTIVAAIKYARVSTSSPTVYIWCAHTINPNTPIETIAETMPP